MQTRFVALSVGVGLSLLLAVSPARSQETPLAARLATLTEEVEAARKRFGVPGLSLAVVADDKVILLRGFGLRDTAKNLPATPDTLYSIGSSTKAFTAAAALKAVEAGKLALADPPRKYLPYFRMTDPETDAKITVLDLLCHRSGLQRTDYMMLAGGTVLTREELIRAACNAKPTAKLGAQFQYQNLMYTAAGEVVAKALGQSYEQVVTEQFLRPLGMRRSTFVTAAALRDPDHAVGYDLPSKKALAWRDLARYTPAGGVISSAREMAAWVRLMLGNGTFEGKPLLSEQSITTLTSPQIAAGPQVQYGLGWFLRQWEGLRVVEHGGNIDGFNAEVAFLPEKKIGLVMLSNVSASPMSTSIQEIVWRNLTGLGAKPTPAPTVAAVPSPVPAASEAGTYRVKNAPVTMIVSLDNGRLQLTVPGQPRYTLQHVSGRTYRLAPPLPETFRATFNETGLHWEQPGVALDLEREKAAAYQPPITVDALLTRMRDAVGGSAALRKHRSLLLSLNVRFENQGMTGKGWAYTVAPARSSGHIDLYAAGKRIGWIDEESDGTQARERASFLPITPPTRGDMVRLKGDFYDGLLDLKTLTSRLEITGTEKVGGEECYTLTGTLKSGNRVRYAVSMRTFYVLRRETDSATFFENFTRKDGVVLPLRSRIQDPSAGAIVTTITDIQWNRPLPRALSAQRRKL